MLCARRAPENVTNIDLNWLSAKVIYPTGPSDNYGDQAPFACVPARSGTWAWRESDIGNNGHAMHVEDRIHRNFVTGESIRNDVVAVNGGGYLALREARQFCDLISALFNCQSQLWREEYCDNETSLQNLCDSSNLLDV